MLLKVLRLLFVAVIILGITSLSNDVPIASAQSSDICGWVDYTNVARTFIAMQVQGGPEIWLETLDPELHAEIIGLGVPGFFRIYDPVIVEDNSGFDPLMMSYARVEKVADCSASAQPLSTPTSICGYSTDGVLQSGMTGYPFPYIITCWENEKIAWGKLGGWGMGTYVRIENPEIVPISPVTLNDGTVIDKEIRSWSDSFEISDCSACPLLTPSLPSLCGWIDFAPPGTGVKELLLTLEDGQIFSFLILEEPYLSQLEQLKPPGYFRITNPVLYNQESDLIVAFSGVERVNSCMTLPAFTPTTIPPIPQSAELAVTNFALAETLTQDALAASHFTTHVLKRNVLWVEVTNTGGAPFVAPSSGGRYILQVIVKQPGGKLEEQEFASPSLEPFASLAPGESQTLMVTDLFFWRPVEVAELEVFLKPDSSLGLSNSILTKTITIADHPDSYLNCIATGAEAVFKVIAIRTGMMGWSLAALGSAIVEKMSKGDVWGALSEILRWFLEQLLKHGVGKAGELFSAGLDAASEIGSQDIPCLKVSDFINAFLHQMLLMGYKSGGVITQSPVYPLVINTYGQRTGFLEDGQIVLEIPNSQVAQMGESRIILFVGEDTPDIQMTGYSNGTMNLYVTLPQDGGGSYGYTLFYENTKVTEGMRAVLATSDREHKLAVDTNRDGQDDLWYSPSRAEQITAEGNLLEIPISTMAPTFPPKAPTTVPPQPTSQPGICGGAVALVIFPFLLFVLKQRQ